MELPCQLGPAHVGQLPDVHVRRQTQDLCGPQKLCRLGHRESDVLAKRIDRVHETRRVQSLEPRSARALDVSGAIRLVFVRQGVQPEVRGLDGERQTAAQLARSFQQAPFGLQLQSVARFDLEGGDALGHEAFRPHRRRGQQRVEPGGPCCVDSGLDAAAGARDVLVGNTAQPLLEFLDPIAAVY